jgi:protein-disulfide isomerase
MIPLLLLLAAPAAAQHTVEGNPRAAVRVVIYEDLQCSDCAAFRRLLDENLLPRFGARVAFEHRDFPLARHAWARPAAIAARYFARQRPGLGLAWRREILSRIGETSAANLPDRVRAFAQAHGLDGAAAVAALDDVKLAAAVEADYQDGVARGISRTPTVLVEGVPFVEPASPDGIAAALEKALQKLPE